MATLTRVLKPTYAGGKASPFWKVVGLLIFLSLVCAGAVTLQPTQPVPTPDGDGDDSPVPYPGVPWALPDGTSERAREVLGGYTLRVSQNGLTRTISVFDRLGGEQPVAQYMNYVSTTTLLPTEAQTALASRSLAGQPIVESVAYTYTNCNVAVQQSLWQAAELSYAQTHPGIVRLVQNMNEGGWALKTFPKIIGYLQSMGFQVEIIWKGYIQESGWFSWLFQVFPPGP